MSGKKEPVHRVQMTGRKRNIIHPLLQGYGVQDALKGLLGGTAKGMMEAGMDGHPGYGKLQRFGSGDCRNGYKHKCVSSPYGPMEIEVPQAGRTAR